MINTYVVTDLTRVNNQNIIIVARSEKRAIEIAKTVHGIKNPSKITLI